MITIRNLILSIIDWFHRPFKNVIPIQTFRYIATGGSNTVLDIFLYYISYNFIIKKRMVDLGLVTLSPHIAALFMSFSVTFFSGFLLAKYITFNDSLLRGRIQLFRYFVTVLVCIILNYIFMKVFVDMCHIYPTPSKILTTCLVVVYSYFSQKYFTFKTSANDVDNTN
jgi:putative flippase GtrA